MDDQGWYADPSGQHQFRWWDGSAWTTYVGDDGELAIDDAPLPRLPPSPPDLAPPPVASLDTAPEPGDERVTRPVRVWDTVRARPLWARTAAAVVVVCALVAIVTTFGADDRPASTVEITGFAARSTTTPPTVVELTVPSTTPTTTRPTAPPTTAAPTTRPAPRSTAPARTAASTAAPFAPPVECDHNYTGCVPIATDVDCAGGSGNGPAYVEGPVRVIGSDVYDLDRDGDGIGCDT
jgi:hypothetical protein